MHAPRWASVALVAIASCDGTPAASVSDAGRIDSGADSFIDGGAPSACVFDDPNSTFDGVCTFGN
jgi:hypothetical protein